MFEPEEKGVKKARGYVFSFLLCSLAFSLIPPISAQGETTSKIAAHSHTAASGETFLLCGQFRVDDTVRVGDGTTTASAEILLQDAEKIMAVVPSGLSTGTLWVWVADGANSVTLNNPEPWWIQPDRLDIGQTTRIFGRNLSRSSSPTTLTVILQNRTGGGTYTYSAKVTEPCVATLIVGATDIKHNAISYGTYDWYVAEPRTLGFNKDYAPIYNAAYHPLRLEANACTVTQTTVVYAKDYGATANDSTTDSAAIRKAILAAQGKGGGIVRLGPGEYLIDEYTGPGYYQGLWINEGVELRGAGIDATTVTFRRTGYGTPNQAIWTDGFDGRTAITSMTINFAPSSWYPSRGILGSVRIENVKITVDNFGTHIGTELLGLREHSVVRNVYAYCHTSCLSFGGRQTWVDGLHIYGGKPLSAYYSSPIGKTEAEFFGTPMLMSGGTGELIVENSSIVSRGGPVRRWLVVQSVGIPSCIYVAHNQTDMLSTPFSNSAENLLFETGNLSEYAGAATIDATSPTILHLTSKVTTSVHTVYSPFSVVVTTGPGLGQVRTGIPSGDGLAITMDKAFVAPDPGSTVTIGAGRSLRQTIVYDNDFKSQTIWATAGGGIAYYGTSHDGVVSSNSMVGFMTGCSLTVVKPTSVMYWHDVEDNLSSTCLFGFQFPVEPSTPKPVRRLGNVFRRNVVRQCDLPPFDYGCQYVAFGMARPWNPAQTPAASTAFYGEVWEDNRIEAAVRGFHMDYDMGDWLVLRRNRSVNATSSPLYIHPSIRAVLQDNTTNTLPWIGISSKTTVPYRTEFTLGPWATMLEQYRRDYFAWGNASGAMTLVVSDPERYPGTTVTVSGAATPMPGATLANYPIQWNNLQDGLHEIVVRARDNYAETSKRIYLFVGEYLDDFSSVPQIAVNPTSATGWRIETTKGTYFTSTTGILYPSPSYHRPYLKGGRQFVISVQNQEISLRPSRVDETRRPYCVLSFITQRDYLDYEGYLRLRLLESDDTYYEFYDHGAYYLNYSAPHEKDRKLAKVVEGTTVSMDSSVAAHRDQESPVFLEQDGNTIRAYGWGESFVIADPNPLAVRNWEVLIAGRPGTGDPNIWDRVSNLFFAKSGLLSPVVSFEQSYVRGTENYVKGTTNTIIWVAPPGADDYYAEWSTNASFAPVYDNSHGWTSSTYCTAGTLPKALVHGTKYYYRVKARDLAGEESLWSEVVYATQDALPPVTAIGTLPTPISTPATFTLPLTDNNDAGLSGVAGVYLFYRRDSRGAFSQYEGLQGYDPKDKKIYFNPEKTGGNGVYEFYTRGADTVGNIEAVPAPPYKGTTVSGAGPAPPTLSPPPAYTSGTVYTVGWTTTDPTSDQYYLEWSTDPSFATVVGYSAWIAAKSSNAQNLVHGRRYYYRVRARNAQGLESLWSQSTSAVHDAMPPATSAGPLYPPLARKNAFTVPWSWNDTPSGLKSVKLFYTRTWPGVSYQYESTTGTMPIQFDASKTGGDGNYFFYTIGTDKAGNIESPPAVPDTQITVLTAIPSTPVLAAEPLYTKGPTNILYWAMNPSAALAYLQWSTNPSFTPVAGHSPDWPNWIKATSYTATPLVNGKYYYRVKSSNGFTTSPWSNVVSSTQDSSAPVTTAGRLTAFKTTRVFQVPWNGHDNNLSGLKWVQLFYRRGSTGAFIPYMSQYFTTSPILFDSMLTGGDGFYSFYTRGTDNVENVEAAPSPLVAHAVTTVAATPPPAPVLRSEPPHTAGTSNDLMWDGVPQGDDYYLEWSRNLLFTAVEGGSGWTSATHHLATGLSDGQVYYFRVKCRNKYGVESDWSNVVNSVQDAMPPETWVEPLPGFETTAAFDIATAGSDAVSGLTSLKLFYRRGAVGSFVQYGGEHLPGPIRFDSLLAGGHGDDDFYFYTVGRDNAGSEESPPRAEWDAKTGVITVVPGPPTLEPEPPTTPGTANTVYWRSWKGPTRLSASCYLDWAIDPGVWTIENASYLSFIQSIGLAGNSGWVEANRYTAGNLWPGKIYYYRARARNLAGVAGPWSMAVSSTQESGSNLTGKLDSVSSRANPPKIILGREIVFEGWVGNAGDQDASSFQIEFWVNDAVTGTPIRRLCDPISATGGLRAGESPVSLPTLLSRLGSPAPSCYGNIPFGYYAIEMRIDPRNVVSEKNEYDNSSLCYQAEIQRDLPNLEVFDFDLSPQDVRPEGGTPISFSGRVQNTGSRAMAAGTSFWIEFRVWPNVNLQQTGPYLCDSYESYRYVASLGPGGSIDLATLSILAPRRTSPLPAGVYYVCTIVDPDNRIAEQRGDDNIAWAKLSEDSSLARRVLRKLYVGARPTEARSWRLYR